MTGPMYCSDCRYECDGRCTRFGFKADMRREKYSAWCRSGERRESDGEV